MRLPYSTSASRPYRGQLDWEHLRNKRRIKEQEQKEQIRKESMEHNRKEQEEKEHKMKHKQLKKPSDSKAEQHLKPSLGHRWDEYI